MNYDLMLADPATPAEIEAKAEAGWTAERKLDGCRVLAAHGRLLTRSGTDVTRNLPEIDPPENHVLDGELVTGDLQFETALRRIQTSDGFKCDLYARKSDTQATLVVFDAMEINGGDVTDRPLSERKELLEPSIPARSGMEPIDVSDDPAGLWNTATSEINDWEGIVIKNPDAPYQPGKRSSDWLKIKNWEEEVFAVKDYERTEKDGFKVYVDIGGDLQGVGVGAQSDQARITEGVEAVEVQYLERTDDDRLRKPSFKGVA